MKLITGLEDNVFICQFDTEATDFDIEVDNIFSSKGICYGLSCWSSSVRKHYLRNGNFAEHKYLTRDGHQLHFRGIKTAEDTARIKRRAEILGISFEKCMIESSRIRFSVEVDKGFEAKGEHIQIHIKYYVRIPSILTYECQSIDLNVGLDNTVEEVKRLIETLEGIPFTDQKLYFSQKLISDPAKLSDYNVVNDSLLILTPRVFGGRNVDESVLNEMFGRRGIISFGQPVDHRLTLRDYGFKCDNSYDIRSFAIELRFKDSNQ